MEFAEGIEGAEAFGGPIYMQFIESWNTNPKVNEVKIEEIEYSSYSLSDITKL